MAVKMLHTMTTIVSAIRGPARSLNQPAGIGVDGAFPELQRVHFTKAFKSCLGNLATFFLSRNHIKNGLSFFGIQGVVGFLAHIDPVKGWHGNEYVPGFNQCMKVFQEQGT